MHNDLNRVILLRRWNSGDLIQRNTLRGRGGGATGSVRIKRDEFREKCKGFPCPGTKQTVRNDEVSVKRGLIVVKLECKL